ncbi:ATP-binding protein [Dinoroseobacter sp. S76]|uniref:sensor histidine kinase n=1 Tax=Dinoroseobacter sp. S76 TaxID=3415124 RepID=UPI003C7AA7CE
MTPARARPTISLKLRLSLGAALLGAATILTASILYFGLTEVAHRLDTALASEKRMARYATASTQAATFLVVASEAVQAGLPSEIRADRIAPVVGQLEATFALLHADVEEAVLAARALGIDEQSRYGTQSLGVARMEATLNQTVVGLSAESQDTARLRGYIDSFAASFDPLLGQAINTERLFRAEILSGIDALRAQLVATALAIAVAAGLSVAAFYFGLIRPQFYRLDAVRSAADQIGQGDFSGVLPVTRLDEIGQLSQQTNRMAAALSDRQTEIDAEWARLNETIATRTAELERANARLEEIDGNRRRFFADISHELRTPLTVILMEAQIGKQASPAATETTAAFATIEARAERLNRKIDDLLRLARSETGQLALDPQPVDLAPLVSALGRELQGELDSAGMTLEIAPIPATRVSADPNWLRQVLVGLVRNAIRHARSGERLHLAPVTEGNRTGLTLTDNGPGIPAPLQDHVFERFSQGSGPTSAEGFGIGLALCRWVIEAQGGEIRLQSPLPRPEALGDAPGLRVTVLLPSHTAEVPQSTA